MKFIYCCLCGLLMLAGNVSASTLNICTDQNNWYPFTYERDGKALGLHVDIVMEACRRTGWECSFTPLPWKRCLENAKRGLSEAVVSASYKDERAKYLFYPYDARLVPKSEWRITQAEYVVITHVSNPYQFEGDVLSIPEPVRGPLGYSIVSDLREQGVAVVTDYNSKGNFKSLINTKIGAVVTSPAAAEAIADQLQITDQIQINPRHIVSKSYFLVFSRKAPQTKWQQKKLWEAVKETREDKEFFQGLLEKY